MQWRGSQVLNRRRTASAAGKAGNIHRRDAETLREDIQSQSRRAPEVAEVTEAVKFSALSVHEKIDWLDGPRANRYGHRLVSAFLMLLTCRALVPPE